MVGPVNPAPVQLDALEPDERVTSSLQTTDGWFMAELRLQSDRQMEQVFADALAQINCYGWWLISIQRTSRLWSGEFVHETFEDWRGSLSLESLAGGRFRLVYSASCLEA